MEALETWAAERIPEATLERHPARSLPDSVRRLFSKYLDGGAPADWDETSLSWVRGWDLFSKQALPVPAALVDTVYTLPSPHPPFFPRTTTVLAAGPTMSHAVVHAALEILERDAVASQSKRISRGPHSGCTSTSRKALRRDPEAPPGCQPCLSGLGVYRCSLPADLLVHLCGRTSVYDDRAVPAEGWVRRPTTMRLCQGLAGCMSGAAHGDRGRARET
jgi:hypothetical protein